MSDKMLEHIIKNVKAIDHIEFVRIGTRIPVILVENECHLLLGNNRADDQYD